jgi:hypothetical protein
MRMQGGGTALWLTHGFAKGNHTGRRESIGSGRAVHGSIAVWMREMQRPFGGAALGDERLPQQGRDPRIMNPKLR